MLRLMDDAESLSITDWKLLTDVLLLGLAESGHRVSQLVIICCVRLG